MKGAVVGVKMLPVVFIATFGMKGLAASYVSVQAALGGTILGVLIVFFVTFSCCFFSGGRDA